MDVCLDPGCAYENDIRLNRLLIPLYTVGVTSLAMESVNVCLLGLYCRDVLKTEACSLGGNGAYCSSSDLEA